MSRFSGTKGPWDRAYSVFQLPDHQGSQEKGGGEPQLSYPVTEKLPSLFGEAPSRWLPLSGAVGAPDGENSHVT